MTRNRKNGLWGDQVGTSHGHSETISGGCGDADQDHRPWPELEGQQLNPEESGGHRCAEHRAHPGSGAGHQQATTLGRGEVEQLPHDRSDGSAGQDDGSFGAEWTSGSDADGTGDRLEDGQSGLNLAPIDEYPLHGLGNAVPPDLLGSVTGHDSHNQTTADGDDDGDPSQRVGIGRHQMDTDPLVVEQVGEEPDHVEQGERDARAQRTDHDGQGNEP